MKLPLKLLICSWAKGIGGGAARMESYYLNFFDPAFIDPKLVRLVSGDTEESYSLDETRIITLPESNTFSHLVELFRHADIVQFQGGFDPLVCEAAKFAEVPLLVEVLHNIEQGGAYENIDFSICVSNAVSNVQDTHHQTFTILNGLDLEKFTFINQRNKPAIHRDKIIFLQVGNRSKLGIHLDEIAPELLKKHSNLEFWIVGREQNHTSTHESIKYFGVVEAIQDLYHAADFNVLFSRNEPFGLAIIEGMACGAIPVVTNNGGFLDIVTEGIDGFLLKDNSREKAVALLDFIILNYSRFQNRFSLMRSEGRKKVECTFSAKSCVSQYQERYLQEFSKKSNLRSCARYELNPESTPGNALIGEAVYHFQSQNFASVFKILRGIIKHENNITHPVCIEVACDLAQFTYLQGEHTLATKLYLFLIETCFDTDTILNSWITLACNHAIQIDEAILLNEKVLSQNEIQKEQVLCCTEIFLGKHEIEKALETLSKAKEKVSYDSELVAFFSALYEKITHSLPVQNIGKN